MWGEPVAPSSSYDVETETQKLADGLVQSFKELDDLIDRLPGGVGTSTEQEDQNEIAALQVTMNIHSDCS